ncbi:LysM peptidoglycan-binding domain-containing protein [Enterococcus pseudoavium]|uniref:LysM peptidoglycan-binding domain-containing protein n=1 Tax=Enterococcus pseudoavium TaxID=44007 RepID=UPI0008295C8E|nr:LysM domain-containing protein [Enterococcus pseudoavium]
MKKFVTVVSMILLSITLTACGNKVTVDDLKSHDWQMDMNENEDNIHFKVSFSDHVMTWAVDASEMKSKASNEWEKMGEDLGKQIVETIKYKVEYELKGKTIHLKEKDLELDDDYSIEKEDKNIVLTPEDKDAEKIVLKPYSKKTNQNETSTSKAKKKTAVKLSEVIDQFKKDGLEVNDARKMTKDDFGTAPLAAKESMIFGIQLGSDGEYQNARIFSFTTLEDLTNTKDYYDDLGKSSSLAYSYTAADEDNLVLMQFNGDLPKELVERYVDTADLELTPVNFETESTNSEVIEEDNAYSSPSSSNQVERQAESNLQETQAQKVAAEAESKAQQEAARQQQAAQEQEQQQQENSQNDANSQYGVVQAGEGPPQIAARYGISVEQLFSLNGMSADNYYFDPGQQIRIK